MTSVPEPAPLAAEIVAVVWVVPGGATELGLNEHVTPDTPEQLKLTDPVKLLIGTTVIVADPLCPSNTLRVVVGVLAVKSGGLARATAKLSTSTEPKPLAISNPVEAEYPITPEVGHNNELN
jgi:hypothetical protein